MSDEKAEGKDATGPAAASRRRRGRPRKQASEKRRHRRYTSLNDRELALLERNRGELSESDYLRLIATRGRRPTLPVPQLNRAEWVRLYETETVLRRLAEQVERDCRRRSSHPDALLVELSEALRETRDEVVRLRRALLGVAP